MIRLYRRISARRTTVNQLSALHIALETRMTPAEAFELQHQLMQTRGWRSAWTFFPINLVTQMRRKLPGLKAVLGRGDARAHQHRRWALKIRTMMHSSGKAHAEAFVRRPLRKDICLYTAGGERSAKTLVICFPGSSDRMMMPLPAFLQHFDSALTDVVLLKDPAREGFRFGLENLGLGFEASMSQLATLLHPTSYRRAITIGVSGGGLAGLVAAALLGCDSALVVSARGPDDSRWAEATGWTAEQLVEKVVGGRMAAPTVRLVHGYDHEVDRANTRALAARIPATVHEIGRPPEKVGHNAIVPLMFSGKLKALLDPVVLGPDDAHP